MPLKLTDESDRIPEINVVSLIDVSFAILTFFVITSITLNRTEGIPVNLPSASSAKSQDQSKIVISLSPEGNILLNKQAIDSSLLVPKIQEIISQNPNSLVVINADSQVGHGKVVTIMDQVRKIPNVKMGIATKK
jgi:biopolymer transport protein ExbD